MARRLVVRGAGRSGVALACAVVALLATMFFFLLHHIGNLLPRDVAVQRFQVELASDRPDEGHAAGYKSKYEYCEISGAVVAGTRGDGSARRDAAISRKSAPNSLIAWFRTRMDVRDAVILRQLIPRASNTAEARCRELEAAVNGDEIRIGDLKVRHWWGGKALYAIALRYASVYEIREFTRIATKVAYLLLAVSLLMLGPKMLLLAAPLVVFGAFFSGTEYWAGVANGFPYLWTVLFATGLALLLRREGAAHRRAAPAERSARKEHERKKIGMWAGTVPVYCFAAGTVSSYLWLGDGHTFLAVTWIGMVVWFGCEVLGPAERTRRATSCIVLYGAGIAVCHALGYMVKAMFVDGLIFRSFWRALARNAEETWSRSTRTMQSPDALDMSAYLDSFYAAYWPGWLPADFVPTAVAIFLLGTALGLAAFEARGGRRRLLWGVLWIVGLILISSLTFLINEHIHYRTARFAFVPLALCTSCLVLVMQTLDWRSHWRRRELPVLLVVAGCVSWYLAKYELNATTNTIESVRDLQPLRRAVFDVYLDGDHIVYVKEECSAEDDDAVFFLHLYPVDVADLPDDRQPHGFDNLDFGFQTIGRRDAWRCAAVRALPGYEIDVVYTGQYLPREVGGKTTLGRVWSESIALRDGSVAAIVESVVHMRPAADSVFDVYLDGNRLVYVNEECGDEDDDAPFFLHVHPTRATDLPVDRQPHGFDNLDFDFRQAGLRGGARCAVVRTLPDYEIAAIHTGQYTPENGRVWSERVSAPGTQSAAPAHP